MTNPLWTERYRPRKLEDVILPESIKKGFRDLIKKGEVPNLLLSGPPGIGKTTVALAVLEELGHDVYVINGSLKGNIDTLRNEIMDFASSVSFTGARKTVLIDEADYLNPQSTQPALRNFMEEFSGNCGFVLTCNFKNKIIGPLRSRVSTIDFEVKKSDAPELAKAFFDRVCDILEKEGVAYEKAVVGEVIKRHYPDWRRVLNDLQRYSAGGRIDTGALGRADEANFRELIGFIKEKNFTAVRKWVGENSDVEPEVIFRKFYDSCAEYFTPDSIPNLVLAIGEYQYKSAHVADQEINLAAFLVYVMASCQLK